MHALLQGHLYAHSFGTLVQQVTHLGGWIGTQRPGHWLPMQNAPPPPASTLDTDNLTSQKRAAFVVNGTRPLIGDHEPQLPT